MDHRDKPGGDDGEEGENCSRIDRDSRFRRNDIER
jgi:hypothetical protein